MNVVLTGGAGFIGSHLTERLHNSGHTVTVVDDCSNGQPDRLPDAVTFIEQDISQPDSLRSIVSDNHDVIFHLAARKAVNDANPRDQFQENTAMTQEVLAAAQEHAITDIFFTSSSTVYGEAPRPTPEDYAPLEPISAYGASKLACESLLSAAAHTTDLTVYTVRFANIVGPRLRGAVIPDFIQKLQHTPETLEILGDGRQQKSYMHIEDCLDAMIHVYEHATGPVATYNLGTRTTTSVDRIAEIVSEEMQLAPTFEYTGGNRGWKGDVPKMRLSIEKLSALGWTPAYESTQAVRRATQELYAEL
ncbi:NAD-dependent epimerase/dehydratase family protein [Salinarchaeum sp. IM2453]|uniref:NAD-dependent epimerase/dehydratase family protein n=1 Tax=Salinarchaeum sp. IM2453 TaxID=2862870 RepID=UPI001C828C1F|nr:NAD-dependent epimerase/dehydratase family protein [Salinarchaeum sp. IM2453]QZA89036.1 NAD-dependent epimerase/dehydratase family protein [Salinarchaeum sp. IM2453]